MNDQSDTETPTPFGHGPLRKAVRPILLSVLLAGMVLTLVFAPSALQAQEGPPGTAPPSGYGAAPPSGPVPPRQLALAAQSGPGSSNSALWWIVGAIIIVILIGGFLVYLRLRT